MLVSRDVIANFSHVVKKVVINYNYLRFFFSIKRYKSLVLLVVPLQILHELFVAHHRR